MFFRADRTTKVIFIEVVPRYHSCFIQLINMSKPFDYSKWDKIELSDDEDDVHPNIGTCKMESQW